MQFSKRSLRFFVAGFIYKRSLYILKVLGTVVFVLILLRINDLLFKYLRKEDGIPSPQNTFRTLKLVNYPADSNEIELGIHQCKERHYEVSNELSDIATADAFIVSLSEVRNFTKLQELYNERPQGQYWVYLSTRPPPIEGADRDRELMENYKMVDHFFNVIMSYRSDSDIPIRPFKFEKFNGERDVNLFKELELRQNRIAWMPNRCDQNSDDYINKLRLELNIDVIGLCGTNHNWCAQQTLANVSSECASWIRSRYMFMLVVDEAFCMKFISPDVFKVFSMNIIPITVSAYQEFQLFPEGSFIDGGTESSDTLIQGMRKYQSLTSDAIYEKFFSWRHSFKILKENSVCRLCDQIENRGLSKRRWDWLNEEFRCYPDWYSFVSSYKMKLKYSAYFFGGIY